MSTESDFTRIFPPRKSDTKANEVPVCRVNIAGHLEVTFHKKNVVANLSLLVFRYCIYSLYYNVNTGFIQDSTACHLKTLPDKKGNNVSEFSAKKWYWVYVL